ncbi:MAG: permease prefix domain 1-containing protein [Oscillospiraceae bacterium]|nr:permease prefix domain 1-containing protein [Oscillospiraceae bacterium]
MEAIKTYLETMFTALPQTEAGFRLKNELMIGMEEKYNELKKAGKSENEAIGTVISEFGNIEELIDEVGLSSPPNSPTTRNSPRKESANLKTVDLALAQEFLQEGRKTARKTAIGVALVLIGVAFLVGFLAAAETIDSNNDTILGVSLAAGVTIMLVFVAVAVAILALTWLKFNKYEILDLNKHQIHLPEHVRQYVTKYKDDYSSTKIACIVAGVVLCILSTCAVIIPVLLGWNGSEILFGAAILLVLIACGVFPLVLVGVTEMCIAALLRTDWYVSEFRSNPQSKKAERIISTVAATYWPAMIAVYLLWSILSGNWHITWVIWPIAGMLFGAFSGGISTYYATGDDVRDELK